MSACVTLEFCDRWGNIDEDSHLWSQLEHHAEGSIESVGRDIERRLKEIHEEMAKSESTYWAGQIVAAPMAKRSAECEGRNGIPSFALQGASRALGGRAPGGGEQPIFLDFGGLT